MRKIAVFVEGLAEQIFVREMLLRMFDYANIGIQCFKLHAKEYEGAPYSFPDKERAINQDNYYMIVNVEGDNMVLSTIKSRIEGLHEAGFEKIIGLRDMFCDLYHKESERQINPTVSKRLIEGSLGQIVTMPHSGIIRFFFAIMEVESWFLGINNLFTKVDPRLTMDYVREHADIDLTADPEITVYHPAKTVGEILSLVGKTYKKNEHDIASIIGVIEKEDYLHLANESPHCSTFKNFYKELI